MYEFLPHTADAIIRVKAPTLSELFREAAISIADFMVHVNKVSPLEEKRIKVEAEDLESLLVQFLTELLALFDSEQFIWNDVSVFITQKNGRYALEAIAKGEKYSPKHGYKGYIKAITYHRIRLEKKGDQFELEFIIDI